ALARQQTDVEVLPRASALGCGLLSRLSGPAEVSDARLPGLVQRRVDEEGAVALGPRDDAVLVLLVQPWRGNGARDKRAHLGAECAGGAAVLGVQRVNGDGARGAGVSPPVGVQAPEVAVAVSGAGVSLAVEVVESGL